MFRERERERERQRERDNGQVRSGQVIADGEIASLHKGKRDSTLLPSNSHSHTHLVAFSLSRSDPRFSGAGALALAGDGVFVGAVGLLTSGSTGLVNGTTAVLLLRKKRGSE